ncbi:methionine--tRNA ligase subunit beta [Candidatus Roizmanbacteria bacterium RIFCSPLOWO2_01_FULL_37_12]|uniref:Methionine--tRNA ligase n=1 Tax=Candidatus Roizmanbacteria bacterium RIFCSPLOWO2_01_FULL_37_12 TaxID=1802056 RepID=A0A1F7ID76_9BACT|nr:MAG: methionine--tRNA ligase subunit beta [Candidatus Roizmanbacteria bacterium RIFCSPHIGHO2_02_FULL_37_9b]OGK41319.1 MAG: methionine--tRNA ligase subunit beta [Candidatus Roizmanbacteria bacterium RIFCSPLOWO2_01_FULL_37_12]
MDKIKFEDWKKVEIKVGQIKSIERVPDTDKLYKLQVDIGEEKTRQVITGLVPYYSEEELKNKKIIVVTNLEPAKFKGEDSQAMLLAATNKEKGKVVILTVEKDVEVGTLIT